MLQVALWPIVVAQYSKFLQDLVSLLLVFLLGDKALRAQLVQLLEPLISVIYGLRADYPDPPLDRLEGVDDFVHFFDHTERVPNVLPGDFPSAHKLDTRALIVDPALFAGGGVEYVPVAEKALVPWLDHGDVLDTI